VRITACAKNWNGLRNIHAHFQAKMAEKAHEYCVEAVWTLQRKMRLIRKDQAH
jgi:hypothetical protein